MLADIAPHRDLAVGVVDVKSYYLETAEDVAERIDRVLAAGVPAERLTLVPDCGFGQTARWAARPKLHALVDGTHWCWAGLTMPHKRDARIQPIRVL